MAHTPGRPWKWTIPDPKADAKAVARLISAGPTGYLTGCTIETLVNGWGAYQDATRESNAALIAAAPDLLAATRSAENWLTEYETGPDTGLHGLLAQLRAAIAKAEGR